MLGPPEYKPYPTLFPTNRHAVEDRPLPPVDLSPLFPQETLSTMSKSTTLKDRAKALGVVQTILGAMSIFDGLGENELLITLKELKKIQKDVESEIESRDFLQVYINYLEALLRNVYISAEELLKTAKEDAKKWRYSQNNSYDFFHLIRGVVTVKGSSGKEYMAFTTSSYRTTGDDPLMSINAYGFTDEMMPGYESCTTLNVALGALAINYYKGEKTTVDGVTMAVVKLFPHKRAVVEGKKKTPKEVIADSKDKTTTKSTVDLPPQNVLGKPGDKGYVPLDKVGTGQQLQTQP